MCLKTRQSHFKTVCSKWVLWTYSGEIRVFLCFFFELQMAFELFFGHFRCFRHFSGHFLVFLRLYRVSANLDHFVSYVMGSFHHFGVICGPFFFRKGSLMGILWVIFGIILDGFTVILFESYSDLLCKYGQTCGQICNLWIFQKVSKSDKCIRANAWSCATVGTSGSFPDLIWFELLSTFMEVWNSWMLFWPPSGLFWLFLGAIHMAWRLWGG